MRSIDDYKAMIAKSRERFERETAEHVMTILHDDGLYRHLRFAAPNTYSYGYDLITWPGHLVIAGDVGDYTFQRVDDMFDFFKGEQINPQYWGEKLQYAHGSHDHGMVYESDLYEAKVKAWAKDCMEQMSREERATFRVAVQEQLLDDWAGPWRDSEHEAHRLLGEFEHAGWRCDYHYEWNLRDYHPLFLWCCWAILRGVAEYKALREPVPA